MMDTTTLISDTDVAEIMSRTSKMTGRHNDDLTTYFDIFTPVCRANVLQIHVYNQALMCYVCLHVISCCLYCGT